MSFRTGRTILERVVFREIEQVGILHAEQVVDLTSGVSMAGGVLLTVACLMSMVRGLL
jgi:hypothetical protein